MRRSLALALLCLVTVCASAGAVQYRVSTGSGGGASGGGGGGGEVLVNDLERYASSRDLTWKRSWHNSFFSAHYERCVKRQQTCYSSPAAARDVYKDSGNYGNPARGSNLNGSIWDQVRIENRCPLIGNGNYRNANSAGGSCTTPFGSLGKSGNPGWQEIHVDAPFASTQPVQGNPVAAIVRVWRECRGQLGSGSAARRNQISDYVAAGSDGAGADPQNGGDECETSPIFERVVPANDGALDNQDDWFFGRFNDGTYRAGTRNSSAKAALRDTSARSAGAFYRACDSKNYSAADRKYGCAQGSDALRGAGELEDGDAPGNFQRSCKNGGLGTSNVQWDDNELAGQFHYEQLRSRESRSKWYRDNAERLGAWLDDPSPTKWPLGVTQDTNKKYFCNELNEWMSINWSLPGASTQSSSKLDLVFNGIPGRLYATQVIYLDRAENILTQSVQLVTSGATPRTPEGDCRTDSSIVDPIRCPRPPDSGCTPGAPQCDSPTAADTNVPEVTGPVSTDCDKAALANDPADCSLTADPAVADPPAKDEVSTGGGDGGNDFAATSAWFPRSFGGEIYNREDSAAGAGAIDANHPDRKFFFGGTPWDFRDIADGQLGTLSFPQDGLRGQGPLLTDRATGSMEAGFSASVSRGTEVPARAGFDKNAVANVNERYRTDDVRYTELIGENRRPSGTWNPSGGTNRPGWRRLTSESCSNDSPTWISFSGNASGCQPGPGGLNVGALGQGWQVNQAYYLPPTDGGDRQRDLAVTFTQEGRGDCKADYDSSDSTNCAALRLDGHGSDLTNRPFGIEVYKSRDYFNGGEPLYHAQSAPGADGYIRFCPPTKTINVKIADATERQEPDWGNPIYDRTVEHWQWTNDRDYGWRFHGAPHNGLGYGNAFVTTENPTPQTLDANAAFYDDAYWGGAPGIGDDVKYYRRKSDGVLMNYGDVQYRIDKKTYRASDFSVAHGRTWWKHLVYRDAEARWLEVNRENDGGAYRIFLPGTKTIRTEAVYEKRTVPNESCVGGPATEDSAAVNTINMSSQALDADGKVATKLPQGQYVIVYKVALGGYPGGHWGILADTSWRDGMSWTNRFTYARSRFFLPVYESRPVG